MDGARNSLYHIQYRTYQVFNRERNQDRHSSKRLLDKAFPKVPYAEWRYVNVLGNKSPYDGDIAYWSERNSKLYDGITAKILRKQNHRCNSCGLKFIGEERIHLHHVDGNYSNLKNNNLVVIHESCPDYIHMGSKGKARA